MGRFIQDASVAQQIAALRRMGQPWVTPLAVALFAVPALWVLYRALSTHEYGLITVALGLGAFAGFCLQGAPGIERAIRGIDSPDRQAGRLRIWTEEWSESIDYLAEVSIPKRGVWTFQFRPQRWTPKAGVFTAECRFIDAVRWPVLLLTTDGLLFPCGDPQEITGSQDAA